MISIDEAWGLIEATVRPLPIQEHGLRDAVGLYLAEAACSDVHSPPHHKSVMDGYAVRSADLGNVREFSVVETIVAGTMPKLPLEPGQVARIMTGAPLPKNADAVVMVELSEPLGDSGDSVTFRVEELQPGQHVMEKSASISAGDEVFPGGHRIRPTDIGLLAETGNSKILARSMPKVAVLPTGDELVDSDEIPQPSQIRNSNGPMLEAMVRGLGCHVKNLGIGSDDESALRGLVKQGLESNLLLLSGGVSAGMLDLVPKVLNELGVRQVFHKVKIKPGKPIWFGVLERDAGTSSYVFGLPGNPVSSLVGFQIFVRRAIQLMMGGEPSLFTEHALLEAEHATRGTRPTWWPGRWVREKGVEQRVQPLAWQGSSDLRALGATDCLIFFPEGGKTYPTGEVVEVLSI